MTVIPMKAGDLAKPIEWAPDDASIDFSGVTARQFTMVRASDGFKVVDNKDFSIVDPGAGQASYFSYTPALGETDVAGLYKCTFRVVWPGAKPGSFPDSGHVDVNIEPSL